MEAKTSLCTADRISLFAVPQVQVSSEVDVPLNYYTFLIKKVKSKEKKE